MIDKLLQDPRVTVRRGSDPDPEGRVVVYWMQRAQRAIDNPAFDVAIKAANELRRPVAVFFGLHPRYPNANLRHYLHFGQISPIRVALAVRGANAPEASKAAFLEELIVRRELAVNYVARNPHYDRFAGCPDWARATLARHSADPRPHIYGETQLESASTHDPLWNAAHTEMVNTGRMHGYLRMYWAKKILEWTETPEAAFEIAVKLNDRYELDGRDPNGYAGISWAICCKHDRPWARREVFGTVRYMSAAGMARKFDVDAYIEKVTAMT